MITLKSEKKSLIIDLGDSKLIPRHENQLSFWGFTFEDSCSALVSTPKDLLQLISKVMNFFHKNNILFSTSEEIARIVQEQEEKSALLVEALTRGLSLKNGELNLDQYSDLFSFLENGLNRVLKEHQVKAILHLLITQNAANFSVPGSGKTTVVLAAYEWFKKQGIVDALFVVGPPACFGPWKDEFKTVLGREPKFEILAGGDINDRKNKYLVNKESTPDLFLTTFQTLQRDWQDVQILLKSQGVKFYLVIDEAHYIKQLDGAWANAALSIASFSARRCLLTGTPFPRNYTDAFNLFDFLWPGKSPISERDRQLIAMSEKQNDISRASNVLNECIGPLFYRVRKSDLGLADQVFFEPLQIEMNKYEKLIYDSVVDRIESLSREDYLNNLDVILRLRRGRMIRLRQCVSNISLLSTALSDYNEDLIDLDSPIAKVIKNYNQLETPAKLEKLLSIVSDLQSKNEKVVIWSNFVRTLQLLQEKLTELGYGVRLIYGGTPVQNENIAEGLTREKIVKEFVSETSGIDILVANPAACAESISLHKTCSHAIYYDMSYNCAQYLQSLDRIHRVGGSEEKESYYHFLQYSDTVDADILSNVQRKAEKMSAIIDQDYAIYSLDMFDEEEDIEAYERLFCK